MALQKWFRRIAFCLATILLTIGGYFSQSNAQSTADQSLSARAVNADGVIEILHEDLTNNSSRYLYFLKTADGRRVRLHFAKHPPTNLLTGDHVSVRGSQSGMSIILASGANVMNLAKTQPPPLTGPLPNTLGAQSTLVILVNFQDAPANQPYTVAAAQSLVFGTVSNFFLENSYQQTWLTGEVVGWYTIPVSSTTCNITSIATYAQAAASAAGVNLSGYSHYVYAYPQDNACGFGGSSNIGGTPSQSWINGVGMETHTVAHELGHAFGLWHSHLLDCGTSATIGSGCAVIEYGDSLDVMGVPQTASPHYNAFQKERLGWLNYGTSPSITTIQAGGTYSINPYELGGSGPNALKILKSIDPTTGTKTWYYVEARQAIGFDGFLTDGTCLTCFTQNETNGVLVHIGTDSDGNSGNLLDMTPATPTYYGNFDPSLAMGQTFTDPAAGVSLTTTSATSTGAAVTVQFTGSVTVTTNQQSYSAGQTVSTMATATYGGLPVSNVSVSFTVTKANGNVVTGSANTGSNGVAVYKVRLTKSDPAGTYVAAAATAINAVQHSASKNFTVNTVN
jgi:M6 family metalloprotease-like protein